MVDRRKFMLSAGALAATGFIGSGSAKEQNKNLTREEYLREFQSSYREGGTEAVKKEFDDISIDSLKGFEPNDVDDDEQITPDESYDEDESELSIASEGIGDDEVRITVNMELDGYSGTVRNSHWIDDAIIISYIEQDWAPVGEPTVSAEGKHSAGFTIEDVKDDAVAGSVDIQKAVFNGAPYLITLVSDFKLRSDGEPSRFWGGYAHTIAPDPYGAIQTVSGGGKGITVEVDRRASVYWDPAVPKDPRDDL